METRHVQTGLKESFQPEESLAGIQAAQGGCAVFVLGGFYDPNGRWPVQPCCISCFE